MQVDDIIVAGTLMQTVDILRDQPAQAAGPFPGSQHLVRSIGPRLHEFGIACLTARPVTLPPTQIVHEVLMLDRPGTLPFTALIAVITNAAGSAATGAGDNQQSSARRKEFLQCHGLAAMVVVMHLTHQAIQLNTKPSYGKS